MIDTPNTIFMFIKVILAFFLLYAVIPSKIIKFDSEADGLLDKLFISFVHTNFFIIIFVHALSFLKIYETFSLLFLLIGTYLFLTRVKGRTLVKRADTFLKKTVMRILDMSEGRISLKKQVFQLAKEKYAQLALRFKKSISRLFTNPFKGILTALLLALGAYIRFHHSFTHLYFGASDCYTHLLWTKHIGNNNIYMDRIYPNGYHAIISALHKLTLIDVYYIARFLGPLAGFMIILSLLYVLKRNFKNPHIVWLALLIYIVDFTLPSGVWRQISPLPQEYAAIFFLPGIHFFNIFTKTMQKKYLLLTAQCLALTLLIHQYSTVFILLGCFIISILNIRFILKKEIFFKVFTYFGASAVVGALPLLIGRLMGHEWHGSLRYIINMVSLPGKDSAAREAFSFSEPKKTLVVFLLCGALLTILIVKSYIQKSRLASNINTKTITGFLLTSLAVYMMYRAKIFGLPRIMDTSRVGVFMTMIVVIIIASSLYFFDLFPANRKIKYMLRTVVCAAAAVLFILPLRLNPPSGLRYEYDGGILAYLKINREDFPSQNWTIISPVEQYQLVMNYGWHTELWEFIYAIEDKHPHKEDNVLQIPTEYVFIYVEKKPLKIGYTSTPMEPVSREDAEKDLPPIPSNLSYFYYNYESRRILQSKAYYWAEDYMKNNDNMELYYEDNDMKVYLLKQVPKKFIKF